MAVALVGLISFQMYWVNLAISVKNERFNQSVHEAMEAVVKGLEKQEILYLASQRIRLAEQQKTEQLAIENRRKQLQKQIDGQVNRQARNRKKANPPVPDTGNKANAFSSQPFAWNVTVTDGDSPFTEPSTFDWVEYEQHQLINTPWPGLEEELRSGVQVYSVPLDERKRGQTRFNNTPVRVSGFRAGHPERRNEKKPGRKTVIVRKPTVASNPTEGYAFNFQYREAVGYAGEEDAHLFLRNDSVFNLVNKQLRTLRTKQDSVMHQMLQQAGSRQIWVSNDLFTEDPQVCVRTLPSGRTTLMTTKKQKEPTTFNDFYANLDTVESIKTSFKENFDKVEKKAEVMQDVFNALVTGERKIDKRINGRMLDSLLKKEIHNQGIDIPFEYGVHSKDNNGILFASLPGSPDRLLASPFKVSLFPNDLNCEGNYLMVNFPGQKQYIFQKLSVVFLSSAVLIMVIISCFYAAISTILKQKKLSEIKNDFISNMTHEFKTPIATISLACEVLQEAAVTDDPVKRTRYLNVIHDENKRLGLQVEKVLQSAMLDKGNLRLKLSPVDIHEIIDQALQNIGVQIEQREGKIQLELDAEKTVVEADEMHLTNIVHNLLDNANKYSPEEPHISIRTRSAREGVYLTVTDKGIGMTKDAVQRIFERFYRVPTGNVHNVKGFGLGLSYVKTILEMHQGHIRVESQPNKGSSFEIYLPYAQG